jgi:nicotinate-nucleotide pyrophosphorylase [carboxylating] (EC 2.4.2.19)
MLTDSHVERWLREDVGHRDVTNNVPGETTGRLVAKEGGVTAGLGAAAAVFEYLDVDIADRAADGERVDEGESVLRVEGPARAVLRGERVAVNVAAHASGVASRTREAVDAARTVDDEVSIAGTRKTTPGLRGIEKRAVAAGGGDTHRLTLSGMVMVKDNHIAELGLERAVERIRQRSSFATKIEVEAETAREALRAPRPARTWCCSTTSTRRHSRRPSRNCPGTCSPRPAAVSPSTPSPSTPRPVWTSSLWGR